MATNIGSLLWVSGIDNTGLRRDSAQASKMVGGIGTTAGQVSGQLKQMAGALGLVAGAAGLVSLGRQVIEVRGQFQQLGIAFETMLGSKEKADKMMNDAVTFAAKTPFTLTDVATNIKQLMAMGIATEDVMDTMKSLGDVAAGVSVPISRVAINYGQVATMGKLQGRELRDFAMAGIPLIDELANNLGKTKNEIQDMVTAGQIGFPLVEAAFKSMSGEGGQFYNLMEKQNASVTGQISNLTDKWEVMLNEIGKSNEGIIYGGISGLAGAISSYQEILDILKVLVVTYGAYKAAMIVTSVARTISTAGVYSNIMATEISVGATIKATIAQSALNKAIMANPYVFAIAAIVGIGAALYTFSEKAKTTEDIVKELNDSISAIGKQMEIDAAIDKYEELKDKTGKTKDEQDELNKSIKTLSTLFPDAIDKTGQYGEALSLNTDILSTYNETVKEALRLGDLKSKQTTEDEIAIRQLELVRLSTEQKTGKVAWLGDPDPETGKVTKSLSNITPEVFDKNRERIGVLIEELNTLGAKVTSLDTELLKLGTKAADEFINANSALFAEVNTLTRDQALKNRDELISMWHDANKNEQDAISAKAQELNDYANGIKTTREETDKWTADLIDAEKKLKELQNPNYESKTGTPGQEIADKKAVIKDLREKLGLKKEDAENELKIKQDKIDAELKLINEEKKIALDQRTSELENQQALLNIKDDGFKKSQEQLVLNGEKEKLASAKLVQELIEQQQQLERDKWEQSGSNGLFTPATQSASDLSPKNKERISNQISTSGIVNLAQNEKLLKELLSKYQDFTAKKEAIDKEYSTNLIALQSIPDSNKKTGAITQLNEDWKNALSEISLEDFQKTIDWASVFGDLDKVSTKGLNDFREKIKQYLDNIDKDISKIDLKTITDAFEELNTEISNRTPISELIDGYKDYKDATAEVAKAQQELNDLIASGKGSVKDLEDATKNLTDAQKEREASLLKATKAVNSIGDQGQKLVSAGNDIVVMLENLGVGVSDGVVKALDGFGQTMEGLSSINFTQPMTIITGGIKAITGLVNTVAAIFGGGSKELSQSTIDYYDDLMSTMDDVIATHKALIAEFSGQEAISETEKAIELINKQIDATRELGKEWLSSRAKHSHSYGYNLQKDLEQYADALSKINVDFSDSNGGIGQLFTMSPEQLKQIKEEVPAAWAKIDDKTRGYLESVIDGGQAIIDTLAASQQALTDLTFDDAKSSLKDLLLSTDTTFADIADNFEGYMRDAIVNALIDGKLTPLLDAWYKNFVTAMGDSSAAGEGSGVLTDKEREALQKEYENIGKKGIDWRNAAFDAAGIGLTSATDTTSTSSLTGSIKGITEDTASLINGRLMKVNVDMEKGLQIGFDQMDIMNAGVGYLKSIATDTQQLVIIKAELVTMNATLKTGLGV